MPHPHDLRDLPLFGAPQPDLGIAGTPHVDDDTSLEAAAVMAKSGKAKTDERRVFEALLEQPDTDDGIERRLDLPHQNASARRRSLELKGIVEWTGDYGKTQHGRRAKIWRVVEGGRHG
jgi:hypothetical protein